MSEWWNASAVMLGISGFFGVVLALAHRWLHVEEDPRVEQTEALLPGTNCGACGQPGCHSFAEALVSGDAVPSACSVSTPSGVEAIAEFLGVDAGSVERRVARLHCAGGRSSVRMLADYEGIRSCRAAHLINGGGRACPWGCLGLGDCDRACTFGAIHMNDELLPVVSVAACTACGDCVDVCPLDLFTLEPVSANPVIQCSSPLTGELARSVCRVTCDACGKCAADAGPEAIEMRDGLPIVLDAAITTRDCTYRCPTGAIVWIEGDQFSSEAPVGARKHDG